MCVATSRLTGRLSGPASTRVQTSGPPAPAAQRRAASQTTFMNSGRELTEALKAASPQAAIREPANAALVSETEGRHGIRLPSDMAWFYRSANGMNWPTEPEHGWIRIWELELWRRIREDPDLGNVYEDLGDAILMADHCDESWWYAADFSRAPDVLTIHLVDGERPAKIVARSFTAFVNAALADAADIYPDTQAAG